MQCLIEYGRFFAISVTEDNICNSLFTLLHVMPLQNVVYSVTKEFALHVSIFVLIE